jgi:hypothetical protein
MPMAASEDPFNDSKVAGIVEHRRPTRVHGDPEVGSQSDCRPAADFEAHRGITRLELADDRSGDANDPRYFRLAHPQAQSKLAQLLPDPAGVEAGETDRFALNLVP